MEPSLDWQTIFFEDYLWSIQLSCHLKKGVFDRGASWWLATLCGRILRPFQRSRIRHSTINRSTRGTRDPPPSRPAAAAE